LKGIASTWALALEACADDARFQARATLVDLSTELFAQADPAPVASVARPPSVANRGAMPRRQAAPGAGHSQKFRIARIQPCARSGILRALHPSVSAQSTTIYGGIMGKALGFASVQSSALMGLTPHRITVEVGCTKGPPLFQMVGLPEAPVREARVRVASALCQLGVLIDAYAITVNLAPADLPKSGATLDLALALGVLAAIERFPASCLEGVLVLGELSLDGSLRPLRGVLPQPPSFATCAPANCPSRPMATSSSGASPPSDTR
jgi:Subunit ChlI of Mg-chelatase